MRGLDGTPACSKKSRAVVVKLPVLPTIRPPPDAMMSRLYPLGTKAPIVDPLTFRSIDRVLVPVTKENE